MRSALHPCRQIPYDATKLDSLNNFAVSKIAQLKVRCARHEAGCAATFVIGTGNHGIVKHETECEFITQPCVRCRLLVTKSDRAKHDAETCAERE
jgi:hypothetical protein